MSSALIEPAEPADAGAVADVVGAAFDTQPAVVGMVAAIRASPRHRPDLTLVARADDTVVGFVMLSGTDLLAPDATVREVLTLTPLAVAPAWQRRGIGSDLVRAAVAAADRLGEGLVVVEGDPAFYGRLGARFAPEHGITMDLPDWAPREAAQLFVLSGYDPAARGQVRYPDAIAAVTD